MKKHLIIRCLALMIVLFACNNGKKITGAAGGGNESLYSSEWKLTEVQGILLPRETKASLALRAGEINRVTGNTGCNRMNGTFALSAGHGIKFSPLVTTRMACVDETTAANEKRYLEALEQARSWEIAGEELRVKNGETIVAKFKGYKPLTSEQAKLNGTWELNYISGSGIAFDRLFPNKKPTIIFDLPNDHVSGNGSCNGYSSMIKLDGDKIAFKDPLSTMMACEGNGEPVYFKTLTTVTKYSITGNNALTLLMGDIAVMRFSRK
jgi:heat shock protein HslJ